MHDVNVSLGFDDNDSWRRLGLRYSQSLANSGKVGGRFNRGGWLIY
jgi:hypothetical protein